MEPLKEIDRSQWASLRDKYNNVWPDGAVAFCILDTQILYPNLAEIFKLKVYSPEGDISNGMIAIADHEDLTELMIHPINNIDKIQNSLANTKIIDWNRTVMVASASPQVQECLERIKTQLGIKITGEKAIKYLLNNTATPLGDLKKPADTYVAQLKSDYIDIVDKTWSYHGRNSYKFFETLMKNELTYVLYSTKDDSPLAWTTISHSGSLTHLYCLEEHRKKGYAEFITKFAVNDQLSKGRNVLAYTVENNVKAQRLFGKLQFQKVGCDSWLFINKV